MPIGKNKKRLVSYVLNATKDEIVKRSVLIGKSESFIAGKMLDEAVKVKGEPLPVCLSNQFSKVKEGKK